MLSRFLLLVCLFTVLAEAKCSSAGFKDLRGYDFKSAPLHELSGNWKFFKSALVTNAAQADTTPFVLIEVPLLWEDAGMPSFGYGTYHVRLLTNTSEQLGVKIPDAYSSCTLIINEDTVAAKGKVGTDESTSESYRKVLVVPIGHLSSDTLDIFLQVSNFVHSKGGLSSAPVIGSWTSLSKTKFKEDVFDLFLSGALVMGTAFFMGLFIYGRQEKMIFYFSLFSLCYAYRIVGWGNYLLHDLVYMPYRLGIILEYSSFYLSGFFFARYIKCLFPEESPKILFNSYMVISLLWAVLTVLPVHIVTQINKIYLIIILIGIIIVCWVVLQALRKNRLGAYYGAFSALSIMMVIGLKTLDYLKFLKEPEYLTVLAQLLFFLFQALILSKYFSVSWRRAKDEAEQAAKVKTEFLSVMSHEIRTPLNAIIGISHNLTRESKLAPNQRTDLGSLNHAAQNLLYLVNNVLDFNKIESGKIFFREGPVLLKPFLQKVVEVFKSSADQKGISLQFDYDHSLPAEVILDKARFNQIITNLIGNGIKFTEKGYVKLAVRKVSQTDKKVQIHFEVCDTGMGIPKDSLLKVFEVFHQEDTSYDRSHGGTGLGLAITKKLIEAMGSKIYVKSEIGKGSGFSFDLNLEAGKNVRSDYSVIENYGLEGYKVLLVEDNEMNVMIARRLLEKWGMVVDVAYNGVEALSKTKEHYYNIILMDLQMPKMDGYETTNILREQGVNVPIIAVTASAMLDKKEKLQESGMNGVITKPYEPQDLFSLIKKHLSTSSSASAGVVF